MKVEDKRNGHRDEEEIGNLTHGLVVEFLSGLTQHTDTLKREYKTGIILDRDMLIRPHEEDRFKYQVPVAFFNGAFLWVSSRLVVKCVDAKVTIDYFDPDEEIPHITSQYYIMKVEKGSV